MSLSNNVKIWILDPTVFNSSRCEFKLPEGNLASSIKLTDLGYYSQQVDGRETGVYYDSLRGVLVTIKSITLYSGSTTLDSISELQLYGALQNVRTTNQGSEDLNRFDLLNGISVHVATGLQTAPVGTGYLTSQPLHKDYNAFYSGNGINRHNNQLQVTDLDSDGASGTLVLSKYLEMLRSLPVLPNIPNLRLVIDWQKETNGLFVDPAASTPVEGLTVSPIRPQLIVEEILGLAPQTGVVKLPYLSTIVEEFVVNSVADGVSNTSSFRSGAFRQRFLKDIVFMNKNINGTNNSWMLSGSRCMAQNQEVLQLVVNGKYFLPDRGINQEAMRMQYLNDTLGPINMPLLAYLPTATDGATFNIADEKLYFLQGQFAPVAVAVNSVIDRLDLEVTRRGSDYDNGLLQSYKVIAFGRVNRLLEFGNGTLRLSY